MITALIFLGILIGGILFVGLTTIFLLVLSDFVATLDIGRTLAKKVNER